MSDAVATADDQNISPLAEHSEPATNGQKGTVGQVAARRIVVPAPGGAVASVSQPANNGSGESRAAVATAAEPDGAVKSSTAVEPLVEELPEPAAVAPERPPVEIARELPFGFLSTAGNIHQTDGPHYRGRRLNIPVGDDLEVVVLKLQESFAALSAEVEALLEEAATAANKSAVLGKVRRMKATAGNTDALGDFDSLFLRLREEESVAVEQIRQRKLAKEALIERAEALKDSDSWKATSEAFRQLFEEWRQVGSAGRETDETTWRRFQDARDEFSKRRTAWFAEKQIEWAANQEKKEELISRSADLADSKLWRDTGIALRTMMDEWKTIGSAGREKDQELWKQFREAQQQFFDRRNAFFGENKTRKEALIARATEIAELGDTQQGGDQLRSLMDEWKQIGSAGRRDLDDALWAKFRSVQDPFFQHRIIERETQKQQESDAFKRKDAIADEVDSLIYASDPIVASEQIDKLMREFQALPSTRNDRDAQLTRRMRKAADQVKVAAAGEGARRAVSWEGKIRDAVNRTQRDILQLRDTLQGDQEELKTMESDMKKARGDKKKELKEQVTELEAKIASAESEIERLESTIREIETSLSSE